MDIDLENTTLMEDIDWKIRNTFFHIAWGEITGDGKDNIHIKYKHCIKEKFEKGF